MLGWAGTRPFCPAEAGRLRQVARFAAAPLAALAARATLAALLEAYLGRRSAAQVQAGALRRGTGGHAPVHRNFGFDPLDDGGADAMLLRKPSPATRSARMASSFEGEIVGRPSFLLCGAFTTRP
jgi:hypothetical protein